MKNMNNKMAITTHPSTITLNANGLNALRERHRVTEWIRKHNPYRVIYMTLWIYAVYKRLTSD